LDLGESPSGKSNRVPPSRCAVPFGWARCERLANGPAGAALYWQQLAARDLRAELPAVRVPTLVLYRLGDRFVRFEHGRYLAEHIAEAKYVELDGDDHLLCAGDGEWMLDEIEMFLTGARSCTACASTRWSTDREVTRSPHGQQLRSIPMHAGEHVYGWWLRV
jgi:hypothetical protein